MAKEGNLFDFSNVASGFENLPEGEYDLSVVKATPGLSKSESFKIDLQLKVDGGEFENRRLFETLAFHPNAQWRTKAALIGMGINVEGEIDGDAIAEELVGVQFRAAVKISQSEGINPKTDEPWEPRNQIAKYL